MYIANPLNSAGTQDTDPDAVQRARVAQAAEQFEGLFIHQMLQQMRKSAEELGGEDRLFKGSADNTLVNLADRMLADALASQRAFGVADSIVRQLLPTAPLKSAPATDALLQDRQSDRAAPPETAGKNTP